MEYDLGKVVGDSGIKESNHNGLLGTLILNDNTCIQWGYYDITQADTWEVINLNRPFTNTQYNIQISPYYADGFVPIYVGRVETDKFSVATSGAITGVSGKQGLYWYCIGSL